MPSVTFHFKVEDRAAYAVRLLRKAYRAGARVAVIGPSTLLDRIDQQLWTAVPGDFVPHARQRAGAAPGRIVPASPIVLYDGVDDAVGRPILVNLTDAWPDGPERFDRIVELVAAADDEVLAGRQRWKRYRELGYPLEAHDASAG